jgi:hypothetical protein
MANEREQYNKNLYQRQFDNELARASGISSGRKGMADQYQGRADSTASLFTGIGSGLGKGLMAMDEKKKTT